MPISPSRILFEDDSLLAVNKLAGELVVGAGERRGGETKHLPLLDFLKKSHPGLRPLHRLDRQTSGIVLFARMKAVAASMQPWEKTYNAIIAGAPKPPVGTIRIPLPARSTGDRIPAATTYRVLEHLENVSIVEAVIMSGKHHQIRKHFSMIGHPLIFDTEEGDDRVNRVFRRLLPFHRFFLHAATVRFSHPVTGKTVVITAPAPAAFLEACEMLRR